MAQYHRSASFTLLALAIGSCMLHADALAETTFRTDRLHLRKVITVASGTGIPQPPTQNLQALTRNEPKDELLKVINKFRAEMCGNLKNVHGESFDSFTKCKKFMADHCKKMDKADDGKLPGYCKGYFDEQKAEEELKELEGEEAAEKDIEELERRMEPQTTLAPSPGPAAQVAAPPAAAEEKAPAKEAKSPPGVTKQKKPDDEEQWYFKDGGKSADRLHMNGDLKLPAQGYWGKLVEHDDKVTVTEDWGSEFGPTSKQRSYTKICKETPNNAWCKRMGYETKRSKDKHQKSAAYGSSASFLAFVMVYLMGKIAFA